MAEASSLPIWRKLLLLFGSFARIAAVVVGGGLAMLPVIEETFSTRRKLLTKEEMLDMVALTQTVPGIVAVNSAVYVGTKVAGLPGAVAAALGAVTPSFVIIVIIAALFPALDPHNQVVLGAFLGVRAVVAALVTVTAFKMAARTVHNVCDGAVAAAALVLALSKVSPALLVLGAMPLGWLYLAFERRRARRAK